MSNVYRKANEESMFIEKKTLPVKFDRQKTQTKTDRDIFYSLELNVLSVLGRLTRLGFLVPRVRV